MVFEKSELTMKSSRRILVIDDERDFPQANVTARTYLDGLRCLTELGPWDLLLLDHDLNAVSQTRSIITDREMTGYDILNYLEANPKYLPKEIKIVSSNGSAVSKMTHLVKQIYCKQR